MQDGIGITLDMLFDDLNGIYEGLRMGVTLLAMLEKAADSPEMAESLGFLVKHLQSLVDDVGLVARYGGGQVTGGSAL